MTNKLFFIIFISLYSVCYSQNDTLKEFYPNGTLKSITPLSNGKKNGIQKKYRKDGTIKEETPYINDQINGIEKGYNIMGVLYRESPYIKNKLNGISKHYFQNGKINIETPWEEDKVNGIEKWYYENGKISSEKPHINNKFEGVWRYYYENGIICEEWPYINDKVHGVLKRYYESGKLKSETPYINGQENGIAKIYRENGKIKKKIIYVNGEKSDKKNDRFNKKAMNTHSILNLTKTSKNAKYGFTPEQPILVGTGLNGGPANQEAYLKLLLDQKGKQIKYIRLGSCCSYKSKNGLIDGMALLDKYEITYLDDKGEEKKATVYISFYDYEEPKILFGFKTIVKDK